MDSEESSSAKAIPWLLWSLELLEGMTGEVQRLMQVRHSSETFCNARSTVRRDRSTCFRRSLKLTSMLRRLVQDGRRPKKLSTSYS